MVRKELPVQASSEHGDNPQEPIKLVTTPEIQAMMEFLGRADIDWDTIVAACRENLALQRPGYDPSTLRGIFAEMHVGQVLNNAAKSYDRVKTQPIDEPVITKHFRLSPRNGGLTSAIMVEEIGEDGEIRSYGESDIVMLVQTDPKHIPLVIEVKAIGDSRVQKENLHKAIDPSAVDRRLLPFSELFGTDAIAYSVIVPLGVVDLKDQLQAEFINRGGILQQLKMSYPDFVRQATIKSPLLSQAG